MKEAFRRRLQPSVFIGGISQLVPDTINSGGEAAEGMVMIGSYDDNGPGISAYREKFKARWVGCGYAQRENVDYGETFASTIRAVTVRLVFAEACARDLMLGTIDVVKAFTQSEMHELLFTEQPTGFEVAGKICKLNMALEGTKQAAHLWQCNLNEFMVHHEFIRSTADPCLYQKLVHARVCHDHCSARG